MAQAEEIIEAVNSFKFIGIKKKLTEFLKPVFDKRKLPKQKLQNYKVFVFQFLNTIVSLTKQPTDITSIREILQACAICCEISLTVERETSIDLKYSVPKLIYQVLLKYKDQEYLDDIYILSEKLYDLFQLEENHTFPEGAVKVIHAAYNVLWNSAVKMVSKDLTGIETLHSQILMQLAICSKFLSLLPNHNVLVDRLNNITTKSAEWMTNPCKSSKDIQAKSNSNVTDTCKNVLNIFNTVISRLRGLCKTFQEDESVCMKHVRTLSQVRCIVIEWLIKMKMYDNAEQMIQSLQDIESEEMKSICEAVAKIYCLTLQTDKAIHGVSVGNVEDMAENLSVVNTMMDLMELDNGIDLWLVHRAYNHFMQQLDKVYFDHFEGQFTKQSIEIMTKSCDIFAILCSKTIEHMGKEGTSPKNNSWSAVGQELDSKKKTEYVEKLHIWICSVHYKKLELLRQVLPSALGDHGEHSSICDLVLETATVYENLLASDNSLITEKMLQKERYGLGYMCNLLGKSLYSKEDYKHAGPLLKMSAYHLHLCNNSIAVKQYELSIECYRMQQLWLEASKLIVDVLNLGTKTVVQAVGMWCKLKKDAILKGERLFTKLTLCSVVESSGVQLKDHTSRDLLIVEYHSWIKLSRRELEVEHDLLTKLLDMSTNSIQKAEIMVELSGNLYLTGQTYKDSSPGEMLNKAIILLDKSGEKVKSTLATAHYRKYIISHEETLQICCPLKMFEKDSESEEQGHESQTQAQQVTDSTPFSYETPYTLETEQSNLPYLIRALELWESSFTEDVKSGQKMKDTKGLMLYDLEMHVDTMIACGTRLIAMKQPAYALRVLHVACCQLKKISDSKRVIKLKIKTAHALMLLGRFDESEQMINTLEVDGETYEKLLLMAELFLLMGKREEGMAVVLKILQAKKSGNMTLKMYLMNGTAKRLLSMFLCFPEGHKMSPVSEDILSLASEAVKQHLTVLKSESKKEWDKSQDKWVLIFEFLQSLLHMCQLYRYTGLPRMAECYVREGIKISQAQGLPRWSCEFVFEALRSESMQVNGTRSIAAVNSIKSILDGKTEDLSPKSNSEQITCSGQNSVGQQLSLLPDKSSSNESDSNKSSGGVSSPEKCVPEQLDSTQRELMSKLAIPQCQCVRDKNSAECDIHIHRLYVKAGIVLSDFLSQYEMESDACRILSDLQYRYPHYVSCFDLKTAENDSILGKPRQLSLKRQVNLENIDPHIKFLSLEAACLQAESLLNKKQFSQVDELWTTMKTLESKGFWNNVIHSDILMTRMALCQASSFMFSIQSTADSLLESKVSQTTEDLVSLKDISSRKKVKFTEPMTEKLYEDPAKIVEIDQENVDTPVVPKKKSLSNPKSVLTPLKANNSQDPKDVPDKLIRKLMLSSKKQKLSQVLGTPLTGRKAKLDFLMASDDEDDIVFPVLKPVTPKSVKSDKTRNVRSRKGKVSTDKTSLTDNEHEASATSTTTMDKGSSGANAIGVIESETAISAVKGCRRNSKTETSVKQGRRKINVSSVTESADISDFTNPQKDKIALESKLLDKDSDVSQTSKKTAKTLFEQSVDSHDDDFIIDFPSLKVATPAKAIKTKTVRSRKVKDNTGSTKTLKANLDHNSSKQESISSSMAASTVALCDGKKSEHLDVSKEADSELCLKGKSASITNTAFRGTKRKIKSDDEQDNAVLEIKGDVFDFNCTPDKTEKGKTKGKPVKGVRKPGKVKVEKSVPSKQEKVQNAKAKETKVTSNNKTTKGKRNLRSDIETVRTVRESVTIIEHFQEENGCQNTLTDLDEDDDSAELSISELYDLENLPSPVTYTPHNPQLSFIEDDNLTDDIDNDVDPIEIVRGGARQKSKGKAKSTAGLVEQENSDMEVVRSSGSLSMKALMEKIAIDCPVGVSTEPDSSSLEKQTVQEEKITEQLEELCGRVSHFAPYPQYPKMCQVLAAKYVDTNPQRAAFLLSESIAVSFRHHAAALRGKSKSNSLLEQSTRMSRDAVISENVMADKENVYFDKDESSLQTMVNVIPSDWCVVQLSVISDLLNCQHFLLTRFVQGKAPVVIEIPAFSTPQGRYVLKGFENVHVQNRSFVDLTDKAEWWKRREILDLELQECIENMEKFWLDAYKGAFLPPVCDETIISSVKKEIKKVLKIEIDSNKLEMILLSKSILSDSQLKTCIKGLLRGQCKDSDIDTITSIVKKCAMPDVTLTSQHHVVLILDKSVQHLPWECIPVLSERSVSRMPCLSHLYYQLSVLCTQESSLYNKGVNPKSTFYIVNPGGDLLHTQDQFKDWFKREEGWKGSCGTQPTREQFIEAITDRDLLIYLGHGSGSRYCPSGEIEKLQAHAVTILMGCSSGKLHVKGQLEPYGIMMSYFLAGCPCMVANLWDVTDKDIDKYTVELLKTWLAAEDGAHLIPFVQNARKACRMKYLLEYSTEYGELFQSYGVCD